MYSDDELYSRFLKGDTSSYDQLLVRYGNSLTFYIHGYTHDLQDAEDLMIEAFARIMAKKPRIQAGAFKAYLYKTARNLTIRFHEKQRNVQVFGFEDLDREIADTVLTEEILAERNRREVLHTCLERIDPELREALWLVYFDDLTYAEAASVMRVSVKRIDHLLTRGKEHMRRELRKEGVSHAYE